MHIRPTEPVDLAQLVQLCREHAEYERADIGAGPNEQALRSALFEPPPRLRAWVAVDVRGELAGFVSATVDFATWSAREFMHMDCLYVRECARGSGVGRALVVALSAAARELGVMQIQWQTPQWNTPARGFYSRLGATSCDKLRFTLELT